MMVLSRATSILTLVFIFFLWGCGDRKDQEKEIRVAVSGNLAPVVRALEGDFLRHHGGKPLKIVVASSGKHCTQIMKGAPIDLFIGADMSYPMILWKEGFGAERPRPYSEGRLILFSAGRIPLKKRRGIFNAAHEGVKSIAVGHTTLAVYGRATLQALKGSGLEALEKKFIVAQNIMQAASYGLHGADVAFLARSALFAPEMRSFDREGKFWIEIDPALYDPIVQGVILLKQGAPKERARLLYEYVSSPGAMEILRAHGYAAPGRKDS